VKTPRVSAGSSFSGVGTAAWIALVRPTSRVNKLKFRFIALGLVLRPDQTGFSCGWSGPTARVLFVLQRSQGCLIRGSLSKTTLWRSVWLRGNENQRASLVLSVRLGGSRYRYGLLGLSLS